MPPGLYMGEGIGVATNSKGGLYIFTRSGESRLFEFDAMGNFVKEFGKDSYGYGFAHSVRVDKDDNVWTVDEGPNIVMKFNPAGKLLMVLGKRPDPIDQLAMMPGTAPFSGANRPYSFHRPTDIGWDAQGNIFISDGYTDARIVKYDKNGRFIKSAGKRGNPANPLEFNAPHTMQVDEKGNVYVGDRGNSRVVVLDNDLNQKAVYDNVGAPWGICISPGHVCVQLRGNHHRFPSPRPDRRHLQDGTGRDRARPVRQGRGRPEGVRQHPHDGLPVPQYHLHRRNPGLARAESHAQAVGHET
jgi:DNA-binding beta-propeller fold protein YncE